MKSYPLQEGTIYELREIAGISMILPSTLKYENNKALLYSIYGKKEYTMENFKNLCSCGVFSEDAKTAYKNGLKKINGDK